MQQVCAPIEALVSGIVPPAWRKSAGNQGLEFGLCIQLSEMQHVEKVHSSSFHYLIYPFTARIVGAPQMISQPVFSILPCSPLPFGTWRTPGLSIPWCYLPISLSVCLVFFPLSLCLARWFWPDTAVCVSLRWSGGLRVVRLPVESWHGLPRW